MIQESNDRFQQILDERAARYAIADKQGKHRAVLLEAVVMQVGNEKLGIQTEQLSQVIEKPDIAVLPHMPAVIEGIAQYRGDIFTVVNIAKWFSITGHMAGKLVAVVETPRGKIGITVDALLGFVSICEEDVASHLDKSIRHTEHPIRFTTRNAITVLDMDDLCQRQEILVNLKM